MRDSWPRRALPFVVSAVVILVGWWAWRGGARHAPLTEPIPNARAGVFTPDPLGESDSELAAGLGAITRDLGITDLAAHGRASVMLVDLSGLPGAAPRHAGIAADSTVAAASIAKLAILTAAYAAAEAGEIAITPDLRVVLERMIRSSTNPDATRAIEILGFERIAATMDDPRIALHDAARGGLWVGKDFTGGAVWRVEPRSGEAHAASAAAVARFYALLARGELVSPEASTAMRDILSATMWEHKFVAGLRGEGRAPAGSAAAAGGQPVAVPGYTILRKSGSYGSAQGDSALIEAEGRRYILVCLLADKEGGEAKLRRLAARVDRMMEERRDRARPGL
jgi:beta-lactamase class A